MIYDCPLKVYCNEEDFCGLCCICCICDGNRNTVNDECPNCIDCLRKQTLRYHKDLPSGVIETANKILEKGGMQIILDGKHRLDGSNTGQPIIGN